MRFSTRSPLMASAALSILLLANCFSPTYPSDLRCGPDDFCPPGQRCSADNICETVGQGPSADASASLDAPSGLGQLESISIGEDLSLALADTHTFVVTATYEGGTEVANNALVIWRTTDSTVAIVDFQGIINPQSAGVVTISADLNGRVDSVLLTVTP